MEQVHELSLRMTIIEDRAEETRYALGAENKEDLGKKLKEKFGVDDVRVVSDQLFLLDE